MILVLNLFVSLSCVEFGHYGPVMIINNDLNSLLTYCETFLCLVVVENLVTNPSSVLSLF